MASLTLPSSVLMKWSRGRLRFGILLRGSSRLWRGRRLLRGFSRNCALNSSTVRSAGGCPRREPCFWNVAREPVPRELAAKNPSWNGAREPVPANSQRKTPLERSAGTCPPRAYLSEAGFSGFPRFPGLCPSRRQNAIQTIRMARDRPSPYGEGCSRLGHGGFP